MPPPSEPPSEPDPPLGSPSRAVTASLRAVERAEHAVFGDLRDAPAPYLARKRVVWPLKTATGVDHRRLPDPLIRQLPEPLARTTSRSTSSIVRLAKYPSADGVRVRAFLSRDGRALTLKVWAIARDPSLRRGMTDREQRVRRQLQRFPAYPVPEVIAAGSTDEIDYLLEPVVFGTTPATVQERVPAAVDIIRRLTTAYGQAGVDDLPLSASLRPDFTARFEEAVSAPWFPWPSQDDRSRLVRRVARLVESDLALPCSLGHGDMTVSNVIRDEQGAHWLIDWEQGGQMPVAFDVRKLLLTTEAPDAVHDRIVDVIKPFDGRGVRRYRWKHQLALGVCNEMAIAPRHRAGSVRRGRLPQFEAKLQARVSWAMELLS